MPFDLAFVDLFLWSFVNYFRKQRMWIMLSYKQMSENMYAQIVEIGESANWLSTREMLEMLFYTQFCYHLELKRCHDKFPPSTNFWQRVRVLYAFNSPSTPFIFTMLSNNKSFLHTCVRNSFIYGNAYPTNVCKSSTVKKLLFLFPESLSNLYVIHWQAWATNYHTWAYSSLISMPPQFQ